MVTSMIPMIISPSCRAKWQFSPGSPWSSAQFMLGKCDSVHSGVAMAFIAVAIVGMCIVSTLGLMGYFQVPNGASGVMVKRCDEVIFDGL